VEEQIGAELAQSIALRHSTQALLFVSQNGTSPGQSLFEAQAV
jgi:hypothetical protein